MELRFDEKDIRPLVEIVVREVMQQVVEQKQEPAAPFDRMLSENEAAAIFAVDPHVLRDARRRGELDFHRVGRFVRYQRSQIQAWIEKTKRTSQNN